MDWHVVFGLACLGNPCHRTLNWGRHASVVLSRSLRPLYCITILCNRSLSTIGNHSQVGRRRRRQERVKRTKGGVITYSAKTVMQWVTRENDWPVTVNYEPWVSSCCERTSTGSSWIQRLPQGYFGGPFTTTTYPGFIVDHRATFTVTGHSFPLTLNMVLVLMKDWLKSSL